MIAIDRFPYRLALAARQRTALEATTMPRLLAALMALALAERRLDDLRAAALLSGRACGLLLCGFRTTTPFALARRFRIVLSCGTPCHAGSAGLAGNCRRRSRRLASFPLALAVARTEPRSITAACCRRPGFGRLFAVIGVFHLSQPWRRASPWAAQGALSIFRWRDCTSAIPIRQTVFDCVAKD